MYSLRIPPWMLTSIINIYLLKNVFASCVLLSTALPKCSQHNTKYTHTSNPVRSAAILKLLEATKPAAFQHPLLFMEKKLLSGCFPHLLLCIQYIQ